MTPASPTSPQQPSAISRHATWIIAAVAFVVLAGLVGLIAWAISSSGSASAPRPGFERYESAWESAMRKASVKATFPAGPVDLTLVRTFGSQSFEATFTAEEMAALMSVYRYETSVSGESFSIGDVSVAFPDEDVAALNVTLFTEGSRYKAKAEAPFAYDGGRITSPGLTSLRVEGFSVSGARRDQAGGALIDYLNRYLSAAPGLSVDEARITTDGLAVKGSAPMSIEHPEPLDL
ncbi:MAG: hypothetical protein IBX63_03570 [Coriobacteriia bacterium]|nr:hypothetical protein [Coriobacteriia bacterium]